MTLGRREVLGPRSDKRTERWLTVGIKDEGRGRSALFLRLRGTLTCQILSLAFSLPLWKVRSSASRLGLLHSVMIQMFSR